MQPVEMDESATTAAIRGAGFALAFDKVRAVMDGSSLAIDAIDYAGFGHKQRFHACARDLGLTVLSGPIPGFGATLMVFSPTGMTVEAFYGAPDDPAEWDRFRLPLDRTLPADRKPPALAAFEAGQVGYLSTNGAAAQAVGGLVGMEAALMIAGIRRPEDQVVVPELLYLDLGRQQFVRFNPLESGAGR